MDVMYLLRLFEKLDRLIIPEKNCWLLDFIVHLLVDVLLVFSFYVGEKKPAHLGSWASFWRPDTGPLWRTASEGMNFFFNILLKWSSYN